MLQFSVLLNVFLVLDCFIKSCTCVFSGGVLFSLLSAPMCGHWSKICLNPRKSSQAADMASFNWSHHSVDPGIRSVKAENLLLRNVCNWACVVGFFSLLCHITWTSLPSFPAFSSLPWVLLWQNSDHCTHLLHNTHGCPAGKASPPWPYCDMVNLCISPVSVRGPGYLVNILVFEKYLSNLHID